MHPHLRRVRGVLSSLLSFTFWSSLLLVAAQLAAGFAFPDQLWGLHHLAFIPAPLSAALVAVVLLLLITARYGATAWVEKGCSLLGRLPKFALFAVVPLAALACFYLFRIQHLLLGDAALVPSLADPPPVFQWPGENSAYFHFVLYRLCAPWGLGLWSLFSATSCLAGALFVLVALLFADAVGTHRESKLLALVLLALTGALQLFCGYVEHYTLMALSLMGALLFLVRWQGHRKLQLLGAAASWLVAFTFHPLASFMAPALALAAGFQLWQWRRPLWFRLMALGLLGATGLVAIAYWTLSHTATHSLLIDPKPGSVPGYTFFSGAHLKDVANEYLLLAPLHGPLLLGFLWHQRRQLDWRDPILVCLGCCFLAAWGTALLIDPLLGSLDWDLLSVYAFPLAALTAYVAGKYAGAQRLALRAGLCLAAAACLHVWPWVGANTDRQSAGNMVEAMVARDLHYRGMRSSKLGVKMQEMDLMDAAIRQYQRAIAGDPKDYLAYHNLAWIYLTSEERSDKEKARAMLERFITSAPDSLDIRTAQGILALSAGHLEEGISLYSAFLLAYPPSVYEGEGFYRQARDFAESFEYYLADGTPKEVLQVAILFSRGEIEQALVLARDLVNRYPGDPLVMELGENLRRKATALLRQRRPADSEDDPSHIK